jgi:PIN domain nuclease of toxin-antitoxin system
VLLWWLAGSRELGSAARALIVAGDSELFVSAASWWELRIKSALNKLTIDWAAAQKLIDDNGMTRLPVTFEHADAVAQLPQLHRDPFDRLLIAQALFEQMRLLTRDKKLSGYGAAVLCV